MFGRRRKRKQRKSRRRATASGNHRNSGTRRRDDRSRAKPKGRNRRPHINQSTDRASGANKPLLYGSSTITALLLAFTIYHIVKKHKNVPFKKIPLDDATAKTIVAQKIPAKELRELVLEYRTDFPDLDMILPILEINFAKKTPGDKEATLATSAGSGDQCYLKSIEIFNEEIDRMNLPPRTLEALVRHEVTHTWHRVCDILAKAEPGYIHEKQCPIIGSHTEAENHAVNEGMKEAIGNMRTFLHNARYDTLSNEDSRALVTFQAQYAAKYGNTPFQLTQPPIDAHKWPGNLVEMEDLVRESLSTVPIIPLTQLRLPKLSVVYKGKGQFAYEAPTPEQNLVAATFEAWFLSINSYKEMQIWLEEHAAEIKRHRGIDYKDLATNYMCTRSMLTELFAHTTILPEWFLQQIAPKLTNVKYALWTKCRALYNNLPKSKPLILTAVKEGLERDKVEPFSYRVTTNLSSFFRQAASEPNISCTTTSTAIACERLDYTGIQGDRVSLELTGDSHSLVGTKPITLTHIPTDTYDLNSCQLTDRSLSCKGEKTIYHVEIFSNPAADILYDGFIRGITSGLKLGALKTPSDILVRQIAGRLGANNFTQTVLSSVLFFTATYLLLPGTLLPMFAFSSARILLSLASLAIKQSKTLEHYTPSQAAQTVLFSLFNSVHSLCNSDLYSWGSAILHIVANFIGNAIGYAVTDLSLNTLEKTTLGRPSISL